MTKRILLLLVLLLLATPLWAANNFLSDANCVGWWDFEASDGTYGTSLVTAATPFDNWGGYYLSSTCKEGSYSFDVERDGSGSIQVSYSLDTDLQSSDFPCLNGSTNNCFTVTCWIRPETADATGNGLFSKYGAGGSCFGIWHTTALGMWYYYGGSSHLINDSLAHDILANQWYFVAGVWDDPNNYWELYCYDETYAETNSETNNWADAMNVNAAEWNIGGVHNANTGEMDGLIDDLRIFSRKLSAAQLATVRADTLDMDAEPNLVAWYKFEDDGAVIDSSGNGNHLKAACGPDRTNYKTGTSGLFSDQATYGRRWAGVQDGTLPSYFPGKSGESEDKITICFWFYPTAETGNQCIIAKGITGGAVGSTSFKLMAPAVNATTGHFDWYINDEDGNSWAPAPVSTANFDMSINYWYHVALRYDDDPNTYDWRVYSTKSSTVVSDTSGTMDSGWAWAMGTGDFLVGQSHESATYYTIDELVVFNDILTDDEIDDIRNGIYGGGGDIFHSPIFGGKVLP